MIKSVVSDRRLLQVIDELACNQDKAIMARKKLTSFHAAILLGNSLDSKYVNLNSELFVKDLLVEETVQLQQNENRVNLPKMTTYFQQIVENYKNHGVCIKQAAVFIVVAEFRYEQQLSKVAYDTAGIASSFPRDG